jgi:hypothetical protein
MLSVGSAERFRAYCLVMATLQANTIPTPAERHMALYLLRSGYCADSESLPFLMDQIRSQSPWCTLAFTTQKNYQSSSLNCSSSRVRACCQAGEGAAAKNSCRDGSGQPPGPPIEDASTAAANMHKYMVSVIFAATGVNVNSTAAL